MSSVTLLPELQESPQVKWVTRGTEQGSEVKFQEPKQEYEGILEGLMAALKAWRAMMSEDGGRDWTELKQRKRKKKKKTEVIDFDMFENGLQCDQSFSSLVL